MPCQSHFRELCNLFHALREAISRFEVAYLLHPDSCYCRPGGEACWQHRGHYKQGSEDLQEAEKTDQNHSGDQDRQEEHQEELFVEGMLEAAGPRYREVEGFENPYQEQPGEWAAREAESIERYHQKIQKDRQKYSASEEKKPEPAKPEELREESASDAVCRKYGFPPPWKT